MKLMIDIDQGVAEEIVLHERISKDYENTVIDALRNGIPLPEQQQVKIVSVDAVLEFLKGIEILHNHDELRSNLIYGIMNLPSVTPQPKIGK